MTREPELLFRAYTRHSFPREGDAVRLLELFRKAGEPFLPTFYGGCEPIQTPFLRDDLVAPARLLSEKPHELLLKRARPSFTASLAWIEDRDRPWIWTVRFNRGWCNDRGVVARLANLLLEICGRCPPVFAACATGSDWSLKHRLRDRETNEDRGTRGILLNPGEGLPGVYWLTFFGPELVSWFGRDELLGLPVARSFDLQESGVGLLLYPSPSQGAAEWRRQREDGIAERLGPEFFFDLTVAGERRARRTPIPGATDHG